MGITRARFRPEPVSSQTQAHAGREADPSARCDAPQLHERCIPGQQGSGETLATPRNHAKSSH